MTNGHRGGIYALAGYLYQIVGMLSMVAWASSPTTTINPDELDELEAILRVKGDNGGVRGQTEVLGEDAVLTSNNEFAIVQFKYSASFKKINTGHLREIFANLESSYSEARARGLNVVACVLATNREFTSRGGAAVALWERKRASSTDYRLLHVQTSMEEWKEKLWKFGRRYGVFNSEIEQGINTLVGRVFSETGGQDFGAAVFKEELIEAFTGSRRTQPLTASQVAGLCIPQVVRFGRDDLALSQWDSRPIERDVTQDLVRAVNERALVVIEGPGGCGKSTLIWQLVEELCRQERVCCVLKKASSPSAFSIVDQVHEWRGFPVGSRPDDSREEAIERLIRANPDTKPIFYLAIDGVDEHSRSEDMQEWVQPIISWFWEKDRERLPDHPPDATLLVSCRNSQDFASERLGYAYDYSGEEPYTIAVGEFSDEEFSAAMRRHFSENASDIMQADAHIESDTNYYPLAFESEFMFGSSRFINTRVIGTLKHPVMWRALLRLEPSTRHRVLEGDENALHGLAQEFINWFHWKLGLRELMHPNLSMENLLRILNMVAQNSDSSVSNMRDEHWVSPACLTNLVNNHEARRLFVQAESAGLIELNDRLSWRWRHGAVYDFLIRGIGDTHA